MYKFIKTQQSFVFIDMYRTTGLLQAKIAPFI
jgi:hypothetical protein